MSDVTRLLEAANRGDRQAAAELLPLVYDELRKLAAVKMAHEKSGQTLDATALVHEAYLRLVGDQQFDGRGHFFAAAAEAMRRILVDAARSRATRKRGGAWRRIDLNSVELAARSEPDDLLTLNDTLEKLARHDLQAAEFAKLRFFGGLSIDRAGEILGLSRTTAYERWTYIRAWLFSELKGQSSENSD
jgi:RNA polymerase sigma factor (TIGR02999 family)